jgi:hypothetical protein
VPHLLKNNAAWYPPNIRVNNWVLNCSACSLPYARLFHGLLYDSDNGSDMFVQNIGLDGVRYQKIHRFRLYWRFVNSKCILWRIDRLCGQVVGVPGCISRGPGSIPGAISLPSIIEDLLDRKSSSYGPESRDYGGRDTSRWPYGTLYQQKLALTSPTSSGRSVGIVSSQTQATYLVSGSGTGSTRLREYNWGATGKNK